MPTSYSNRVQQVLEASNVLENSEIEYSLHDLIQQSGLPKGEVLQILKNFWIDSDELDIVYLNLTREEENSLEYFPKLHESGVA